MLFDQICSSRDYYPTAREMTLLPRVAAAVASRAGVEHTEIA